MKRVNTDWEWDKKPKRVEKGTNKAGKYRKTPYNMLSEYSEELDDDNDEVDVRYELATNVYYTKQR